MNDICDESTGEVWTSPELADLLVFDGSEWRVARRKGMNYYVEAARDAGKKAWMKQIYPLASPPDSNQ